MGEACQLSGMAVEKSVEAQGGKDLVQEDKTEAAPNEERDVDGLEHLTGAGGTEIPRRPKLEGQLGSQEVDEVWRRRHCWRVTK